MIRVVITADSKYPVERKRLRQMAAEFLREQGVGEAEVGIAVVGDRKMRELNKKHMKKEGTTDVLSFPQTDGGEEAEFIEPLKERLDLGDVVVSFPQAVKQAMEQKHTVDEEIEFLVKHGLLHLLGIHHD